MALLVFAIAMSFMATVASSAFDNRMLLSRKSALGSTTASLLTALLIVISLQSDSLKTISLAKTTTQSTPQTGQASFVTAFITLQPGMRPKRERGQVVEIIETVPTNIIDAYSDYGSGQSDDDQSPDFRTILKSQLNNGQLSDAMITFDALLAQEGFIPASTRRDWERLALSQIRPIPASDKEANLAGYLLLSQINPDEPRYTSKIEQYRLQ